MVLIDSARSQPRVSLCPFCVQLAARSQNAQKGTTRPTFRHLQLATQSMRTSHSAQSSLLDLQTERNRYSLPGGRSQPARHPLSLTLDGNLSRTRAPNKLKTAGKAQARRLTATDEIPGRSLAIPAPAHTTTSHARARKAMFARLTRPICSCATVKSFLVMTPNGSIRENSGRRFWFLRSICFRLVYHDFGQFQKSIWIGKLLVPLTVHLP